MPVYYIIILGFLFILAISLLLIGVSNDAVNFLNSAIGSKAAPFKIIITIAAIGILVGAVFSNGMMEVARKGIFNPEYFAFSEIMIIFLSVMLANILLLDLFNTIGLPTSTTISVVFGILGAATAVAVFKIASQSSVSNIGSFINIESSMIIIAGIFLSIVIAFNAGIVIQWIVRLAFSFNIQNTYKYWAGVWGGFAITAILYFLLIKGAKGSTLISPQMLTTIRENTIWVLLISFVGWTIIFQLLVMLTKINILKITVLVGTFALAMAFAGNDLVNFIGVPLAGFESFKSFLASGATDASGFLMGSLREPINTPILFLIAAGMIMVVTLRFSKKAKSVTATTIDLSRQGEGSERFTSTSLARFIVRNTVIASNGLNRVLPAGLSDFVRKRFDEEKANDDKKDKLAFDLVRASVNLVVASILIAIGTSYKLPLSTTYVTFMVAMGTSLADGAWGRDSAVFRITGVLTVVGGWFFTAFLAFTASFIIATIIFFGKMPVILILIGLSTYILLKTHAFHKRKSKKEALKNSQLITTSYIIIKSCEDDVKNSIVKVSKIVNLTYTNFFKENHKELKSLKKESKNLSKEIKEIRDNIPNTLRKFEERDINSGHHYVQIVTYMKEMSNSIMHIIQPAFDHLDNNHAFDKDRMYKLKIFNDQLGDFFNFVINILNNREFNKLDELTSYRDNMVSLTNEILLNQVKSLKKIQKGVKLSATYIEMLSETKNLLLNVVQLVKAETKLLESILAGGDSILEDVLDE